MADINLNGATAVTLTEQSDKFLREALETYGVASQVTTIVNTISDEIAFPRIASTNDVAWATEGAELDTHDLTFDDVVVRPSKVGAVTTITNEVMADVSAGSGMASMVMDSLTSKIAKAVDAAFFGALPAPAPAGLEAQTGVTVINAGAAFTNADPFVEAVAVAQGRNANLTAWVANPSDALALGKIRKADGSNEPLLMSSAVDGKVVTLVAGVPLLTSPEVTPGHVYGIPASRVYLVQRAGAEIKTSTDALFSSDRTMIRGTARFGFGFVDPESIVRIEVTASDAEGE